MLPHLEKKLLPVLLTFPIIVVVLLLAQEHQKNNEKTSQVEVTQVASVPEVTTPRVATSTDSHIAVLKSEVIESKPELYEYIQVIDGCDAHYKGSCVNVRVKPDSSAYVAYKLRNGVILRVSDKVTENGRDWYKVHFDEWLRYPSRVSKDLYVAAEYVTPFHNEGTIEKRNETMGTSTKRIIVDRSKQMLYAYDGDEVFMKEKVSTGLELTPTPRGTFTIYRKTPSRYMQGPIPGISTHYYDLPGVPWNLYFSKDGAVIHGAYWHESFGRKWSNGCVNLPIESAAKLYEWAEVGTKVIVRD